MEIDAAFLMSSHELRIVVRCTACSKTRAYCVLERRDALSGGVDLPARKLLVLTRLILRWWARHAAEVTAS